MHFNIDINIKELYNHCIFLGRMVEMKLISWNVNGLRAAHNKGFDDFFKEVELNDWYKNRDFIILNVSPLSIKDKEGYQAIVDLINHVLKKTKYSICLLPHVTTEDCNDLDILLELQIDFKDNKKVYLEENEYDCQELKYIIS